MGGPQLVTLLLLPLLLVFMLLHAANTQTFEEEAEFRAGIDDTRGKRRAAGPSSAGQQSQATLLAREEARAAQQLQTAALAYVRCLQQLLQVRFIDGPHSSAPQPTLAQRHQLP